MRTSTVDLQDALAPDPSLPAKTWIEVLYLPWYCGRRGTGWPRAPVLAIGLRSSGIKKECPEIDGRASCSWNLGCPCWLAGWVLAPSLPECESVAAVSQRPPVSGLPGCQAGERKRAAAAAGHPQVPPPCMRGLSNDTNADAMLDHAIFGWGCEYLTGQDYPDSGLRGVSRTRRQKDGTDRLGAWALPYLPVCIEYLVQSTVLGGGKGRLDSDVPGDAAVDWTGPPPACAVPRECVVS